MKLNTNQKKVIESSEVLLIDFDGTLVNTNPLHLKAYNEVLKQYRIELGLEEYVNNLGGGGVKVLNRIFKQRGVTLPVENIVEKKAEHYRSMIEKAELQAQPVIADWIRHGSKCCIIVTDGIATQVRRILQRLELLSHITDVVSREDVLQTKPAPDLYLLALAKAARPKGVCVALEDTLKGEAAAIGAGLTCIRGQWFDECII